MSEHDKEQKTEEPTGKQRSRFREQGDMAKSQDLTAVVTLLAVVSTMVVTWPIISQALGGFTALVLGRLDCHGDEWTMWRLAVRAVVYSVAPIAIVSFAASIISNVAQIGFNFTLKPLAPSIKKFNPLPKLKNMFFSVTAIFEILKSLFIISVIGTLSVNVLLEELSQHGRLAGLAPIMLFKRLGEVAIQIVIHATSAILVIAIIDLLYQRYRHHQKMKMTKDEVKQEHKDQEGDPIVKNAIRRKQYEQARNRMMSSVASANVVVVNPTHYSVAIRYRMTEDAAPTIVAMGMDHMAAKIREHARKNGVPVISNPPLARGLYKDGKMDRPIPKQFYRAVAELLAWVYSITGKVA